MDKIVGIVINEKIAKWQEEALDRIEKCGFKLVIFALKKKQTTFNYNTKLLFLLESKLLASSNKYLVVNQIQLNPQRKYYLLKEIKDIHYLPLDITSFKNIIVLNTEDEEMMKELSKVLLIPILYFDSPFTKFNISVANTIISAYKKGKAIFELNFYCYSKGVKSIQYATCSSIETGLLLRSINAILAKCPLIIQRVLLSNTNSDNLLLEVNSVADVYDKGKRRRMLGTFLKHLFEKVYYKRQWVILYKNTAKPEYKNLNSFQPFIPPKTKFWADPFILTHQNKQFVFFEEADSTNNKGYISCSEMSKDGLSKPFKVLETDYHLSFPNVFKFNNHIYMIPESAASNAIELWRCSSFPNQWELLCKLINNIKGVDTIIKFINNKWWLFTTVKPIDHVSGNEELCIYYADDLITDQWTPHPKNPVLSDARMGRNAGKIEHIDGKYYRYGQFSGHGYGKALAKSEIVEISETTYREKLVDIVFPDASKGFDNLHTFNFEDNLAVGDALQKVKRFF